MSRKYATSVIILLLAMSFLPSCSESPNAPAPQSSSIRATKVEQLAFAEPLAPITEQIPELGTISVGAGDTLLVGLVDTADSAKTGDVLRNMLPRALQKYSFRFTSARLPLRSLFEWKATLRTAFFADPGAISLDVDENAGVIKVGVTDDNSADRTLSLARDLGIPDGAVRAFIEKRPELTQWLRGTTRPWLGGISHSEIGVITDGQSTTYSNVAGVCSITLALRTPGGDRLLTASHCTSNRDALDPFNHFIVQNEFIHPQLGGNVISTTEVTSGPSYSCGALNLYNCRYADASLFGVPGDSMAYARGRIAKPYIMTSGASSIDSDFAFDRENPFVIDDVMQFPLVNQLLHKVGRTTGWTHGVVYATCVDTQPQSWWRIVCSDKAFLGVKPGDSGAPVFARESASSNLVYFAGLIFARDPNVEAGSWLSNSGQIGQEIGIYWVTP